jgi:membrane associated rhomboid family serine protease
VSTPPPSKPPHGLSRKQQRRQELLDTKLLRPIRPTSASGALVVMATALAVLWAVLGVDAALGHPLLDLGIKPRQLAGLPGVVLAPVLHASAGQLAALSIPFAVLGWLTLTAGLRFLAVVTVAAALTSGLVGWLAGPSDQVIVGVSGVLLGWLGYLLARALFGRRVVWIVIAVAVAVVFSGLFNGLQPGVREHEFWGSQVASFVVGVGLGALLHRGGRNRPVRAARAPR